MWLGGRTDVGAAQTIQGSRLFRVGTRVSDEQVETVQVHSQTWMEVTCEVTKSTRRIRVGIADSHKVSTQTLCTRVGSDVGAFGKRPPDSSRIYTISMQAMKQRTGRGGKDIGIE